MSSKFTLDSKVYAAAPDRQLSMRDLLDYFSQVGPMRASDLHIKVGSPPIYRVDGLSARPASATRAERPIAKFTISPRGNAIAPTAIAPRRMSDTTAPLAGGPQAREMVTLCVRFAKRMS